MKQTETLRRAARLINDLSLGTTDEGRELANSLLVMANSAREVTPISVRMMQYDRYQVIAEVRTPDAVYSCRYNITDRPQGMGTENHFPVGVPGPNVTQMLFHFGTGDIALLDTIARNMVVTGDEKEALVDLKVRVTEAVFRGLQNNPFRTT